MNPIDKHIGQQMRSRRRALGLKQKNVAEKVGVTLQQISKYEDGITRISAARLFDVCRALDVAPGFFFDGISRR